MKIVLLLMYISLRRLHRQLSTTHSVTIPENCMCREKLPLKHITMPNVGRISALLN